MLAVSMCGDLLMGHRTTLRYLVCRVNAPTLRHSLGVVMRLLLQHESMGSLGWLLLTPHVHVLRMLVMRQVLGVLLLADPLLAFGLLIFHKMALAGSLIPRRNSPRPAPVAGKPRFHLLLWGEIRRGQHVAQIPSFVSATESLCASARRHLPCHPDLGSSIDIRVHALLIQTARVERRPTRSPCSLDAYRAGCRNTTSWRQSTRQKTF
jgi:hypothetical protein